MQAVLGRATCNGSLAAATTRSKNSGANTANFSWRRILRAMFLLGDLRWV